MKGHQERTMRQLASSLLSLGNSLAAAGGSPNEKEPQLEARLNLWIDAISRVSGAFARLDRGRGGAVIVDGVEGPGDADAGCLTHFHTHRAFHTHPTSIPHVAELRRRDLRARKRWASEVKGGEGKKAEAEGAT